MRLVSLHEEKEIRMVLLLPCEDTSRRWPSASLEESFHQNLTMLAPNLTSSFQRIVRNKFLFLKPPNLLHYGIWMWHFKLRQLQVREVRERKMNQTFLFMCNSNHFLPNRDNRSFLSLVECQEWEEAHNTTVK